MAESKLAVYGAIAAGVAIAATKFFAASVTGSSAMLSEAIHTLVDICNDGLLLIGLRLSARPATVENPFGHGKELYFWSLIVAVLIFGVGGGFSLYEGIRQIRLPEPLRDPTWNYVVLGAAAVFEALSLFLALRTAGPSRPGDSLWQSMRRSKDPTSYTVVAEDGAALIGLAIAALGIASSHHWNMPELDGVASIVIALLLGGVALVLIHESKGLLIGEGIRPETARDIRAIALRHHPIREVGRILSMYIGPDNALVVMDVDFNDGASTRDAAKAILQVEDEVRQAYPMIKKLFIEARVDQPRSRTGGANAGTG